jgi:hypothetical protein
LTVLGTGRLSGTVPIEMTQPDVVDEDSDKAEAFKAV